VRGFLHRGWITEALAVADAAEATITNAYAGRGMYGATCLGVIFEERSYVDAFLAALGVVQERTGGFDAVELARWAQVDNMGKGWILYFPGWEVSE